MSISTLYPIYFSPTGSSRKTANAIAGNISAASVQAIDLTLPQGRENSHSFSANDLVILSLPVYGGRIPLPVADTLEKLHGKNTPVILAAVYGNRAYEDALLEMKDIMTAQGFIPIAAGAFIAEHSKSRLVGTGRPNQDDLAVMSAFGRKAAALLEKELPSVPLEVPGNHPYKQRSPKPPVAPVTSDACIECGSCARVCPTAAIPLDNPKYSDPEKCILCQACEKVCPINARSITAEPVLKMTKWLEDNYQTPLSNEVYYLPEIS